MLRTRLQSGPVQKGQFLIITNHNPPQIHPWDLDRRADMIMGIAARNIQEGEIINYHPTLNTSDVLTRFTICQFMTQVIEFPETWGPALYGLESHLFGRAGDTT